MYVHSNYAHVYTTLSAYLHNIIYVIAISFFCLENIRSTSDIALTITVKYLIITN